MYTVVFKLGHALVKYPKLNLGLGSVRWLDHVPCLKGFWHHAKIQRDLMIQFQENSQIEVRREGWRSPVS